MKTNAYKKFLPAALLVGVLLAACFSIGALAGGTEEGAWEKKNGKWYYFDADGAMQTGWLAWEENSYYLNESGVMQTGWVRLDGTWYYFSSTGAMQTGWVKWNSKWYYLDSAGAMQTGRLTWKENSYYLNESGAMQTGWVKLNGDWFWFSSAGEAALDWNKINNDWYYFYTDDNSGDYTPYSMAADTEIDGYVIRPNGVAIHDAELTMVQKAATETSSTNWLILVDTAACKTGVFKKSVSGEWSLYKFWNCAPGATSSPTVKGRFTVKSRGYSFYAYGSLCYYYVQFYGNYLFHSITYNADGTLQDGRVGQQLSHGCVRLATSNAKWLYNTIPNGTKVYIY